MHVSAASAAAVQMVGNPIGDEILAGAGRAVEAQHQRLARGAQRSIVGAQHRYQAIDDDVLAEQRCAQIATES